MTKYTTITVKNEVKKELKKYKGERSWDEFLLNLLREYIRLKRVKAAEELEESFTKEELDKLEKIIKREKVKWKFMKPEELF